MGILDGMGDFFGGIYHGVADNPDWSLHGAHNWFVGGDATAEANKDLRLQQYGSATGQLQQMANNAQGQQAPQISGANMGTWQSDQSRAGMYGVANQLGGIASGQQAGAGELAVNRQMGQAQAQQVAQARMAHGANSALAMRNAARNSADMGLAGAGQAAQAQMSDQQAALAQQGQLYGAARTGDINAAQQQAQLAQQAQIANQQARLSQTGLNNQQQQAALTGMLGWDQANAQTAAQRAAVTQSDKGILSGIFSGVGAGMASSDERLKTDLADGGDDADEMMDKLRPKTGRYIDEDKHGSGKRLWIIAQDLARSRIGKEMIGPVDEEGHLGFDVAKAANASLAAIARLNERLRKVEGERRSDDAADLPEARVVRGKRASESLGYMASRGR